MKPDQWAVFWLLVRFSHELPSAREERCQCAKQHRSVKQLIAVLVEEGLFVAAKVGGSARVDRNIGVVVSIGLIRVRFANLRDERILADEIAASILYGLCECTDNIIR